MADSADGPSQLRHLLNRGRSNEALVLAERTMRGALAPDARADVLLLRLAALINVGRRGEYATTLDAATESVRVSPRAERYGQLYTLAALIASLDGSVDRSVTYLVKSSRALSAASRVDSTVACAWHDLAMAYSYVGLHGYALSAIERARRMAAGAGLPEADFVVPAIRVRLALWHDHHGDTDACVRVLRDVVGDLGWHGRAHPDGLDGIRPGSLGAYGYAAARLAALGSDGGERTPGLPGVRELLDRAGSGQGGRDIRSLGEVCLDIAVRAADRAIALLDGAEVAPMTLGGAEPQRLRALAHLAAGRPAAAHTADRRAFRIASAQVERLRELHVESVAARIDQQDMQRSAALPGATPLTDPLTGLSTRPHLDRQVATALAGGEPAVLAICRLGGLAAVNEAHGRLSGDLVLQRMAALLARVMRRGDMVARYGGSRFAVLLHGAGPDEAGEVAGRIEATVATEDWADLVPGTPVTIRVEWSEVGAAVPRSPCETYS